MGHLQKKHVEFHKKGRQKIKIDQMMNFEKKFTESKVNPQAWMLLTLLDQLASKQMIEIDNTGVAELSKITDKIAEIKIWVQLNFG